MALVAVSLAPSWLVDMAQAPVAASIRLWSTVVVAVLLIGVGARVSVFRYVLAGLVIVGALLEGWAALTDGILDARTALITIAQLAGVVLLFTPAANRWFAKDGKSGDGRSDRQDEPFA